VDVATNNFPHFNLASKIMRWKENPTWDWHHAPAPTLKRCLINTKHRKGLSCCADSSLGHLNLSLI
jgi:hypothetical protein